MLLGYLTVSGCIVILTEHECPCTRPDFRKFEKSAVEGANPKQTCRPNNINCTKLSSNKPIQQITCSEGAGINHSFQGTGIFSSQCEWRGFAQCSSPCGPGVVVSSSPLVAWSDTKPCLTCWWRHEHKAAPWGWEGLSSQTTLRIGFGLRLVKSEKPKKNPEKLIWCTKLWSEVLFV